MRIPLLSLLLLLFLGKTAAQTNLRGLIKDRKAKPVAGVLVGLWGIAPNTTTGLGQFELALPKRDEFLPGSKLVFTVQKDGWSVLDESELLAFVPRDPKEIISIRMVKDSERDADLREQEKNIRGAIEREFKEQEAKLRSLLAAQNVSADSVSRLHTRLTVLSAERDQALAQVTEMLKTLYKVDLEAASQLYRDAYALTTAGKVREANDLIEKADLDAQLQKIEEEERQHKIRLEALAKGRCQIAETYALQAKNALAALDFAGAERAYDKAAAADPTNDEVIFAFAVFLEKQNNLNKAAIFYEKSLPLSTDEAGKAAVLNNLGIVHSANQKMPEAEKAYGEALSIRRTLADKNPDAFLPDMAATLNNLGIFYSDNQKMPEAEKAYGEALSIHQKLTDKNPDAFLPDVAMTLNNLGAFYKANQKMPEAEKAYGEALSIYRRLADKKPDAFLPYVVGVLNNLGVFYSDNQKMPEAEKTYSEALSTRRKLADKNPDAFLPGVAMTLNNLGVFYKALKQYSQALDRYAEAFHIREAALLAGQGHFFKEWMRVWSNISQVKDSTAAHQQYALTARAGLLLASSCDTLRHLDSLILNQAVSEYGSLSWWAVFAQDYALAERAGLRALALDEGQFWVWTNIGHALWLSGKQEEARAAWLHLQGKMSGEKPYATVLNEDWDALEAAGVVPKGAFKEARKWVGKW